jgi:hypothetical protein
MSIIVLSRRISKEREDKSEFTKRNNQNKERDSISCLINMSGMLRTQFQMKKCKGTPIEWICVIDYLQFLIIAQVDQLLSLIFHSLSLYNN